ncbi:hypothetical protein Asd1617_01360 [Shigella dysenteriae 1617]|uniref:Uncharacterized protein n=1 Tax=Shigella dysenteriae 1617 TaxID=754093 RepID=A0A0A6ZQA2_SHIDY|nr:hypothetical protein Asd1617_01360 [Shigella dysenteriae 1617]
MEASPGVIRVPEPVLPKARIIHQIQLIRGITASATSA